MRQSYWVNDENCALLTDLYELTMLQSYYFLQMNKSSVFSLFARKLPSTRNYLIACGLDNALSYLENLHFSQQAIDYLQSLNIFRQEFLDWLSNFHFTGDVFAMPEGTPCFANEPILEVIAPIGEAQVLETFLLNQIHFQTIVASKASRVVTAARDKTVVDFGVRRMHGADAGIKAARACYIAGVHSTSNVLAGQIYNIPVSGTMAHSYIQAHDNEMQAFRDFASIYPETIILIDTYDSLEGTKKVIQLSKELEKEFKIRGVRIDSSDLGELSFQVRKLLDDAGLQDIKIFASGSLDEYRIDKILKQNAPIDGFGVGSKMGVAEDSPYADMVYKLTSYAGKGRIKISPGKETLPNQKQVFRVEKGGKFYQDTLCEYGENHPGRPLLQQVMKNGQRLKTGQANMAAMRQYAEKEKAKLPKEVLGLDHPVQNFSPVNISLNLKEKQQQIIERHKA